MNPKVGDALEPFRFGPINPQAMVVWSEILKDPNPIHLDVEAVKAMGLGIRRINQGPANLAYLVNGVLQSFPRARIEKIVNRFVGNVLEDDLIVVSGIMTEVEVLADGQRVACDMVLAVEGRGPAVSGTVQVFIPC
ncbi:MAG: MaoC/PaaZ C-terminal domain-containing protein [Rhodocyclaceae bacterium]|jgi:acyl dehydratase|nr:MaoC/PaaZ C-terminal domain-containing protein [Rhodocyclaceae bacterium]